MLESATWTSLLMLGLLLLTLPLTGAFMAAMPYLMPKRECFAVTVPDAAVNDPFLRGLKRGYLGRMLAVTALGTVVAATLFALAGYGPGIVAFIVATLAVMLGGYGLMLRYRAKVRAYKRQQGWEAEGAASAGFVGDEPFPRAISLKWDLVYLVPIALTMAVGILGYGSIPDVVPMHIDLQGNVTDWAPKSPGLVAFPVVFLLFVDGCMVFSHWSILRSKKATDPAMPAASAWAYGRFARTQSILLLMCGLMMGVVGLAIQLSFIGVLTIWESAVACGVPIAIVVIGSLAVSVAYGQNGSRLISRMSESGAMATDDDRFWKAGIFYCNPADASLFLPERFGIGWTLNWGRPAAWAILAAFVLVTIGFMVAVLLLV